MLDTFQGNECYLKSLYKLIEYYPADFRIKLVRKNNFE